MVEFLICIIYIMWIASVLAIIAVAFEKKNPDVKYTRWDIFSYVMDVVLICFFMFMELCFLGYGFAGTVEGLETLLAVADLTSILIVPISFGTIAWSIVLRKKGKSKPSFWVQFSTLPVYVFCTTTYYMLFG